MPDASTPDSPEAVVRRWLEARNSRHLDAILDCLTPDVDFHPLRLGRPNGPYNGHAGVRQWFEELSKLPYEHVTVPEEIRTLEDGRVLAVGSLRVSGERVGPFCGLYQLSAGRIDTLHHYVSDLEIIRQIGLIS